MKKEFGRSMVEMLGTLAIIGVLSVTALTGYKIAMTKNRTNNILYDVNLAMNEIATREYMSLPVDEEAPVSDLGVKSEFDIGYARLGGEEKNGFYIAVDGITPEVCETLRSNKTAFMAEIQPYNGDNPANSCEDANAVYITFPYPPIEGGKIEKPVPCDSDEYFKYARCYPCPSDATCDGANVNCGSNKYFGSASCFSCPSDATCDGTKITDCGSTDQYSSGSSCYPCPSDATCDGTANVNCSDTSKYFYGGSCRSCPSGATCDGTKITDCGSTDQFFSGSSCDSCPSDATCDGTANVICDDGYILNQGGKGNSSCCDKTEYFSYFDDECYPCPSDATCNGITVICSDTSKYLNVSWRNCQPCPADATCDGTDIVICDEGWWDELSECCFDDDVGSCL